MLENPEITQTEAESTAVIHLTIPREEIRSAMGPGMKEVIDTVAAQGITPRGPVFARHLYIDPESDVATTGPLL